MAFLKTLIMNKLLYKSKHTEIHWWLHCYAESITCLNSQLYEEIFSCFVETGLKDLVLCFFLRSVVSYKTECPQTERNNNCKSCEEMNINTVNDLFSAQCAKQSLFVFNICWEKMSLLAHPS